MDKKPLDCIVGMLYNDSKAWKKIKDWCEVSSVAHKLKDDHIGLLGHVYEGMLDMNSDPTMFDAQLKMHIEHIEMEDLEKYIDDATSKEVNNKIDEIKGIFEMPEPVFRPHYRKS